MTFIRSSFLAAILLGLTSLQMIAQTNVVFVMADDLGWGDPGCYNPDSKIAMPYLDQLADAGMRFTDAHTPSSVCTPTRYGVLTGRYAWRTSLKNGVLWGNSPALIEKGRQTVATMLKANGYHTGVVGKWHLGLGEGFTDATDYTKPAHPGTHEVGFDYSYIIPASLDMDPYLWLENDLPIEAPTVDDPGSARVWAGGGGFWRAGLRAPSFSFDQVLPTIASKAVNYIEERAKTPQTPFFLYVPLASPHTPWVPSQAFKGKNAIGAYGDFVQQTDWALGQIMQALDDHDLAENTLLIFTSDNGSHWPEHMIKSTGHRANTSWRGQKADIHEAGHRVPFVVRWPKHVKPGTVSNQLLCLTDLIATTAALVEHPLAENEGEDSYNMLPVFTGQTTKPIRKAIVHHSLNGMFAMRIGKWKLIEGQGSGGFTDVSIEEGEPEGQLYDLNKDPSETNNVFESKAGTVAKLRQTLTRYQETGRSRLQGATADLLERLTPDQFKRVHQEIFRSMLRGDVRVALSALDQLPMTLREDGESHYMRAVAHSMLGETDAAVAAALQATANGVPLSRFVGGTLTGLDAMQQHPAMQRLRQRLAGEIVHGPMLGCLTGDSVKVWVRTMGAATVQVKVSEKENDFSQAIASRITRTNEVLDYTTTIPVTGLKPNTSYFYRVIVGEGEQAKFGTTHAFNTLALPNQSTKFRLAFGGGAGYVPENERAWDTIRETRPDILLLLGDNVYSDDPESPAMQHYCYYRRQSRPEYSRLISTTPTYTIWDDHDFGVNDCVEGPAIDVPAWKRPVYRVFRNNWVNPAYGGGDARPGCYYDFTIGDVHFIMLDGRYYRNLDPSKGEVSMLGSVQRDWLLETIKSSTGTFKVLCSPVPWVFEAKGDSKDTWNGYQEERHAIFSFLEANKIEGILLMSADRHRSDLWKIERDGTYPLYEFNSSRLTNQHVHQTMAKAMFSYNQKQSFGLVEFDTTINDPSVSYSVVTIDGDIVHTHSLNRSALQTTP